MEPIPGSHLCRVTGVRVKILDVERYRSADYENLAHIIREFGSSRGRMSELVARMPVKVIVNDFCALYGAGRLAVEPREPSGA